MANLVLLVDFGSTFTKILVVDLQSEEIVSRAQAPSTVNSDMTLAYFDALREIEAQLGKDSAEVTNKFCCSSAAGGLRIVCCGLVPSLTSKAAQFAAYSAGGKVVATFSYELTKSQVSLISQELKPDIVLLVGGTEGGDKKTIIRNAGLIADEDGLKCPIILGGNSFAVDKSEALLKKHGKNVISTENVLPGLDRINTGPAQAIIRKLFMEQIIWAKGLGKAKSLINPNVIPTPLAVFNAGRLLSCGFGGDSGLGELMLVDIGGCTTDIDSFCTEKQAESNVIRRGIPEPFGKRTVEGDLGIRANASTVVDVAGKEMIETVLAMFGEIGCDHSDIVASSRFLSSDITYIPNSKRALNIDELLASLCLELAVARHAGKLERTRGPSGREIFLKSGKDLRSVKIVVGTGGIFAHGDSYKVIFQGANSKDPLDLAPENPEFYVDKSYILYAMGLLSESSPAVALRILKKSLARL